MAQLRCTNVAFCCNGCTTFSVDGANGRLLEVTDDLSCSIFSANTIAGLPVIEAFANYCVSMGQFGGHKLEVTCTSIRGGKCTTASGTYSFVGGGCCNVTSDCGGIGGGAVVGGGFNNCSVSSSPGTCLPAFIGGGRNNYALGGAIAGGRSNQASAPYTFVGGGNSNTSSGYNSAIGGGYGNTASEQFTFVGGGIGNTASGYRSVVVGGGGGFPNNEASNAYSFLGGGFCNKACGYVSFVGGGQGNTAGNASATNGNFQVAVGGLRNTASGNYSFIGGGSDNFIDAASPYNSIIGGCGNTIGGALGSRCNAHIVGSCITAGANNYTYVNNLCCTGGGLSDCRVKNTIEPIRFGLDHIAQLQPVSFCWNGDASCHKKYGFIAQNVQQAMSCVVTCSKLHRLGPDGTQILSGEEGEPLLEFEKDAVYASYVNAFKELKAENDALKQRITAIENILKNNNLL